MSITLTELQADREAGARDATDVTPAQIRRAFEQSKREALGHFGDIPSFELSETGDGYASEWLRKEYANFASGYHAGRQAIAKANPDTEAVLKFLDQRADKLREQARSYRRPRGGFSQNEYSAERRASELENAAKAIRNGEHRQ